MDTVARMPSAAISVTPMAIGSGMTMVTRNTIAMHAGATACHIGHKDTSMVNAGQSIDRIATMPGVPRRMPAITAIADTGAALGITPDTDHPMA